MKKNFTSILTCFYNKKSLKFNQLKGSSPSNKLAYYLDRLISQGYLKKESNLYKLTDKGEIYLVYLNKDKGSKIIQPLQDVLLFPVKSGKFLFQRRRKRPFMGMLGPIGGKRKFGESLFETAKRELYEDTGLTGNIELKGLMEIKIFKEKRLFLHYVFNVFKITELKGSLKDGTAKGDNVWISMKEYCREKKKAPSFKHQIGIVNSKFFTFIELNEYVNNSSDLIKAEMVRRIKLQQ